jgi:hypothetical protein
MFIARSCSPAKPVTFDAGGGGGTANNGFTTTLTAEWSHNAAGPVVLAYAFRCGGTAPTSVTRNIIYGTEAMTSLGTIAINSEQAIDLWKLQTPASGPQTVSVTVTTPGNTGMEIVGESMSFNHVGSFGMVTSNSGTGTVASLTVASNPGEMIAMVFGDVAFGLIDYNQTSEFNAGVGGETSALIGYAPGASSVPFSATIAEGASTPWAGIAVRILPVT